MDLAKWLGGLGEGSAIFTTLTSLASVLGAIVWSVVRGFRKQRDRDMAKEDRPTIAAPPPFSPELAELRERLRSVERDQDLARLRLKYESSLEERQELRIEVEQLQNALTTERRVNAELRARIEQVERELADALIQPDDGAQTWTAPRRDVFATPLRPPRPPREVP